MLKDHLGSTSLLYTGTWNASTSAFANPEIENQSFNPWGERRDAATWANFRTTDTDAFRTSAQDYDRGYTGHEQLDDSGLIHMNGRIYDPEIGRFLSPDPFVQVPEYSQNFNRYSYVMNNPLNAVDPSGFSWVSDTFHKMGSFLHQNWRAIASIVFALAMTYATGGLASPIAAGIITGATTGAFDAAINGGNSDAIWRGALVSAVQGGISSGILHPIGAAAADSGNLGLYGLHIVGHGLVGGAANEAMGGKFQDGFISASVSTAASDMGLNSFIGGDGPGGRAGRTIVAGIIGGTASELGGGKFSNGFYTAAFQHLLNDEHNMNSLQAEIEHMGASAWFGYLADGGQIFSDIKVEVTYPEGTNMENTANNVYQGMKEFEYFNDSETYKIQKAPIYGKEFMSFTKTGTPTANVVKLTAYDHDRVIVADTAMSHMLIGTRNFRVIIKDSRTLILATGAIERANGVGNRAALEAMGFRSGGQHDIWKEYYGNIAKHTGGSLGKFVIVERKM